MRNSNLRFSERNTYESALSMLDHADPVVATLAADCAQILEWVDRQRQEARAVHHAWEKAVREHLDAREQITAPVRASRILQQHDGRSVVSFQGRAFEELAEFSRRPYPTVIGGPDTTDAEDVRDALVAAQKFTEGDPDLILGNLAEAGWRLVPPVSTSGRKGGPDA
jgi:hypothetical protein